jgi:hypothetical protein
VTLSPSPAETAEGLCRVHIQPVALHGGHRALVAVAAGGAADDRDVVLLGPCIEPDQGGSVVAEGLQGDLRRFRDGVGEPDRVPAFPEVFCRREVGCTGGEGAKVANATLDFWV